MPSAWVVAVIVGILAGVLAAAWLAREWEKRSWRAFAERRGLEYVPPPSLFEHPEARGRPEGRSIRLQTIRRSHGGKHSTTFTVLTVGLEGPMPAELRISPATFLSKVGRAAGAQDVATGDADFDAAFIVRGRDPEEVRAWLTSDRRRAILPLRDVPGCEVRPGALHAEQVGVVRRRAQLARMADPLAEAAAAIDVAA